MTTGYEARMYADISRIAKALERIATALEQRPVTPPPPSPEQAAKREAKP